MATETIEVVVLGPKQGDPAEEAALILEAATNACAQRNFVLVGEPVFKEVGKVTIEEMDCPTRTYTVQAEPA